MKHKNEQKLFEIGQSVKHSIFGTGTIIDTDNSKSAYIIQFDNIDTPRAISFRAKLEKKEM